MKVAGDARVGNVNTVMWIAHSIFTHTRVLRKYEQAPIERPEILWRLLYLTPSIIYK